MYINHQSRLRTLEIGKQFHAKFNRQSLFWQLVFLSCLPRFEGFESDVFLTPFPHANLKGRRSRTTKMELFDQVTSCLGILERKTIVLVAEARSLYRV